MSKISRAASNHSTSEFTPRTWFFGLVVVALLLANYTGQAQNKEDEYFRIYTLIQQADSLSKNGENVPALSRYQQAQAALRNLPKDLPGLEREDRFIPIELFGAASFGVIAECFRRCGIAGGIQQWG